MWFLPVPSKLETFLPDSITSMTKQKKTQNKWNKNVMT